MQAIFTLDKLYLSDVSVLHSQRKIDNGQLQSKVIKSSLLTDELANDTFWNYKHISIHNNYHSY